MRVNAIMIDMIERFRFDQCWQCGTWPLDAFCIDDNQDNGHELQSAGRDERFQVVAFGSQSETTWWRPHGSARSPGAWKGNFRRVSDKQFQSKIQCLDRA